MATQGRRRPDGTKPLDLEPGDYVWWQPDADGARHFLAYRTPTGLMGTITAERWKVTEEPDGSITVSPSIFHKEYEGDQVVRQWHGFLERGAWREC